MPAFVSRPRRSVLLLVSLAPLMANADAGLVLLAAPDMQRDLSMSLVEAHWVTNVYVVLAGGLQLLGGRLCDRYGARRLLLGSLVAFAVASMLCTAAPNVTVLLSARAAQAVAAAVLVPAAMCVLLTVVPEAAERRRGLALWAACGGIGSVAGVLAGGLASSCLNWRWAFLLNVPLALAAFAVGRRLAPRDERRSRAASVDVPAALCLVGALLALVYALVGVADHGFGPVTWLVLAVAVLLAAAFARRQVGSEDPLLPAALLHNRSLAAGALGIVFIAAATSPIVFVGSVYLQEARGYSAWKAGCALLPVVGGVVVVGRWCARVLGRFGSRGPCLVGCASTGSGLVLLTFLTPESGYATGMLPGLVLIGAGLPMLWMACEIAAVSTVGRSAAGASAGVLQCAGQIGAALGLALAVTMYDGAGRTAGGVPVNPAALTAGVTRALWCCVALMLCVAVTAQWGLRIRRPAPGGSGIGASSTPACPPNRLDQAATR